MIGLRFYQWQFNSKSLKLSTNDSDNNTRLLAGYVAFNGHVFSKKQAKWYNQACDNLDMILSITGGNKVSKRYQAELHSRLLLFKVISGIK